MRYEVYLGTELLERPHRIVVRGLKEDEFFRMSTDSRISEYKDGAMTVHAAASRKHQDIVGFLETLLRICVRQQGLGEVYAGPFTMRLRPGLDREPDIFFVPVDNLDRVTERCLEGAADLVIEVVSEDDPDRDLVEKRDEYEKHGVAEYWAVEPEAQRVRVFRRRGEQYREKVMTGGRLTSERVPGFWIEVGWLFEQPLPAELDCLHRILGIG